MLKQKFIVRGRGAFPYDMLRYDECWPFQADDARKLDFIEEAGLAREITLISYIKNKKSKPTADRWRSFGWIVVTNSNQL